jgi:DNA-binding PadR family transcriptional regulator
MAFVDERKQDNKSMFRITAKGRNALGETRVKTGDMPSVPKPGEVVPFLRALSESLTMMADRLEEYDG